MNLCTFVGRLTKNPEMSFSEEKQIPIAKFTLAVDRGVKKEGETNADFIRCVAFDKRAEFVERYLTSGMRVAVNGKVRNENYTNKAGEKIYGFSLFMDNIEFADGKKENSQENPEPQVRGAASPAARPAGQASGTSQSARTSAGGTGTKPAASQPAAQKQTAQNPAPQKPTSQRPAANPPVQRTSTGRTAPVRPAASRTAGNSGFNRASNAIENGVLPFN